MKFWIWVVLFTWVCVAFEIPDSFACNQDSDCFPETNGAFTCKDGICELGSGHCITKSQCSHGQICENNKCERECSEDEDCPDPGECYETKCLYPPAIDPEKAGCVKKLKSDAECGPNERMLIDATLYNPDEFKCINCKWTHENMTDFLYVYISTQRSQLPFSFFGPVSPDPAKIESIQIKNVATNEDAATIWFPQVLSNDCPGVIETMTLGDVLRVIPVTKYSRAFLEEGNEIKYAFIITHLKSQRWFVGNGWIRK